MATFDADEKYRLPAVAASRIALAVRASTTVPALARTNASIASNSARDCAYALSPGKSVGGTKTERNSASSPPSRMRGMSVCPSGNRSARFAPSATRRCVTSLCVSMTMASWR